jgi:hypothetical protein
MMDKSTKVKEQNKVRERIKENREKAKEIDVQVEKSKEIVAQVEKSFKWKGLRTIFSPSTSY